MIRKLLLKGRGHDNTPLRREFDRIEEQVEQDLAEPLLVTNDKGR